MLKRDGIRFRGKLAGLAVHEELIVVDTDFISGEADDTKGVDGSGKMILHIEYLIYLERDDFIPLRGPEPIGDFLNVNHVPRIDGR